MSEDDDFAMLKKFELLAKSRGENKAAKVLEVLLTDLSFDASGPLEDACQAIEEWGVLMDAVIRENIDHSSILSFVEVASKNRRAIEMAELARERHAKWIPAIWWVRAEWLAKASEYSGKQEFAKTYVALVLEEFPEIREIKWRTIAETWLKGL